MLPGNIVSVCCLHGELIHSGFQSHYSTQQQQQPVHSFEPSRQIVGRALPLAEPLPLPGSHWSSTLYLEKPILRVDSMYIVVSWLDHFPE